MLLLSVVLTGLTFFWLSDNLLILLLLLINWGVLLRPFTKSDLILFVMGQLIFVPNNIMAVKNGTFTFTQPDLLGLPVWEYFMWGYYFVVVQRWCQGTPKVGTALKKWMGGAVLFAMCFSSVQNMNILLFSSCLIVLTALLRARDPMTFKYFIVMVGMGTIVEAAGLAAGHWTYPQGHIGGLPLWYIPMWGGTGVFFHKIAVPTERLILGYLEDLKRSSKKAAV